MATVAVGTESRTEIRIHRQDVGSGQPVVLAPGSSLRGRSWEIRTAELLDVGYADGMMPVEARKMLDLEVGVRPAKGPGATHGTVATRANDANKALRASIYG